MEYLQPDKTQDQVTFDRVNNMVEFLQCYPLQVKKDKNVSHDMDDVLHPKEKPWKNISKVQAISNDQQKAQKLMMYVWSKMCDQTKNIGQTFRIFDTKNKGKLRKCDFVAGLERFSIALSSEDSNTLWEALDVKKRGFLVFEDFQGLTQGGSVKLMQDPYLQIAIQTHVQDNLAAERKQERERIA